MHKHHQTDRASMNVDTIKGAMAEPTKKGQEHLDFGDGEQGWN